jgi:hypothetical protein
MEQSPSSEATGCSDDQGTLAFYGNRRFITVSRRGSQPPEPNPVHTLPPYPINIHFCNIPLLFLYGSIPSGLKLKEGKAIPVTGCGGP